MVHLHFYRVLLDLYIGKGVKKLKFLVTVSTMFFIKQRGGVQKIWKYAYVIYEWSPSVLNQSITLPDEDLTLLDYSITVDEHSLEDGELGSLKEFMTFEKNKNLIVEDVVVSFYNFE